MVMLARRASCDKKTLARQVIPLAPGYRTALSSRPEQYFLIVFNKTILPLALAGYRMIDSQRGT